MIKSSVYYYLETNKIYLMTPVYIEQIETIDNSEYITSITKYQYAGLICDNGSAPILISTFALNSFEYIGCL